MPPRRDFLRGTFHWIDFSAADRRDKRLGLQRTRAFGVATGTYAIAAAMDELAYALKMDPLELRLRNYVERDPHSGKPFTEKHPRAGFADHAGQADLREAPAHLVIH